MSGTYIVLTENHYWGKADNLFDAAKNAHVGWKPVRAAWYYFPESLYKAEEVYVDDMGVRCVHPRQKELDSKSKVLMGWDDVLLGTVMMQLSKNRKIVLEEIKE